MGIKLEVELSGRLQKMLRSLQNPDFGGFMQTATLVMQEDHIKGVMAGTDAYGNAMEPVKYRTGINTPSRKKQPIRNARFGQPAITPGDNLTTAEYRKLTGPPLAPRGLNSRVIKNFVTRHGFTGREWFAEAALVGIVSRKGVPFMEAHFEGRNRLPRRDLRGLRPETMKRIQTLLALEIRRQFFDES